jgi:hypothetical protein
MSERLVHYTYEGFNAHNTRESAFSILQEATKDRGSCYRGFARKELERVMDLSEAGKQTIIDMIFMCNDGGHTGFSINWVVPMFKRILNRNGWVEYDENSEEEDYYGDMIQMNVIGIYCIYDIRCKEHMFSKEEKENPVCPPSLHINIISMIVCFPASERSITLSSSFLANPR